MIPEREREALMGLTMCAREECHMCRYKEQCDYDFQCELATKNMKILADALTAEQTEPSLVKDSPSLVKDLVEGEPTTEESSMVADNENCIDCVHFEQCTTNGWTDCHYMPIADCPWK